MAAKASVFIAMSLDGFIARRDDSLDWLDRVQAPPEDYGYAAFMKRVDAVVMGRRTFDVVKGFSPWPFDGKRVVVMSRSAVAVRDGVEATTETPAALLERLGREGLERVYVDGGGLIRSFLHAGLIDELIVTIIPVLLGAGLPLFGHEKPERILKLEGQQAWATGVAQLHYRVT